MWGASRVTSEPKAILIVEDDEPTQNLLRVVLQREGYATTLVANGQQAIDKLQASPHYAAIVLDIMMPVAGGHAVMAFLESIPTAIPVVVCSAAGPAALRDFRGSAVKAIVRKPFEIDDLVSAVRRAASGE